MLSSSLGDSLPIAWIWLFNQPRLLPGTTWELIRAPAALTTSGLAVYFSGSPGLSCHSAGSEVSLQDSADGIPGKGEQAGLGRVETPQLLSLS